MGSSLQEILARNRAARYEETRPTQVVQNPQPTNIQPPLAEVPPPEPEPRSAIDRLRARGASAAVTQEKPQTPSAAPAPEVRKDVLGGTMDVLVAKPAKPAKCQKRQYGPPDSDVMTCDYCQIRWSSTSAAERLPKTCVDYKQPQSEASPQITLPPEEISNLQRMMAFLRENLDNADMIGQVVRTVAQQITAAPALAAVLVDEDFNTIVAASRRAWKFAVMSSEAKTDKRKAKVAGLDELRQMAADSGLFLE